MKRTTFSSVNGHTVLASHLPAGGLLIDLGANRGDFSRLAEQQFGLRPTLLVEANPKLAQALTQAGRRGVINCAVSGKDGMVTFNLAANDEGSSILSLPAESSLGCIHVGCVEVATQSLDSLMAQVPGGTIDLLKVDIEGAEVEALLHASEDTLGRCAQISVEFHCDPVFGFGGRSDVERVIARMRGLGFDCFRFNGILSDVLFVNHGLLRLGWCDRLRLHTLAPPPRWILRGWSLLPAPFRSTLKKGLGRLR